MSQMNNSNMFPPPSTSSSSSHGGGLTRYGSAPSSVLSTAVDSIGRQFSSSAFAPETANFQRSDDHHHRGLTNSSSSSLVRHSSMPAGFLDHLPPAPAADTGFSITRGMNIGSSYDSNSQSVSRLNSQLSFTRPKEALSRISEENDIADHSDNAYNGSKRSSHFTMESQFQFGMPQTALELATMDNLLNIPQDSVPCKIRAKRGCATHPRSIAERLTTSHKIGVHFRDNYKTILDV